MTPLPFPTGIVAFTQQFPDEAACQRYLFALRFPDGFVCPKCGVTRFSPYRGSLAIVQCPNHHLTSLTAGTIMHGSKQPLLTWFWAAYFVSTHTPGISAVQFQKHLQVHRYETAFHLLHKMRSALVAPDREPLHGVIEMDETYIQNKNQDRAVIIGAIEVRDRADHGSADYSGKKRAGGRLVETRPQVAGRLRLQVIPDETAVSFLGFATKNVLRGSFIHTDGDPSYNALGSLGYDHRPKVQGKGKSAVYGLDHLHRAFSNFKNWLSGTHHDAVLPKHIQAYANEYVFRHNRRGNPWAAFNRCLGLGASREAWPEYETLYRAGMSDGWTHPNPRPGGGVTTALGRIAAMQDNPALVAWLAAHQNEVDAILRGLADPRDWEGA